jgi:thiamine kinase-like enzyme
VSSLNKAFKHIPLLQNYHPADFKIRRLPGLTNHTYHLKNYDKDWVLRIPKMDTNAYIDRKAEITNNEIAVQLGLAPNCLWRDDSGLSLTTTLPHTKSPVEEDLRNPDILKAVLAKLEILHNSQQKFHGRVNIRELLERYFSLVPAAYKSSILNDFNEALQHLTSIEQKDNTLTPSHNDLILQNLLIDANRQVWFIDWEYSSMASPYWDLATLCNAADFNHELSVNLLNMYHSQHNISDIDLLMDYRQVLKVLTLCWMLSFNNSLNHATPMQHNE